MCVSSRSFLPSFLSLFLPVFPPSFLPSVSFYQELKMLCGRKFTKAPQQQHMILSCQVSDSAHIKQRVLIPSLARSSSLCISICIPLRVSPSLSLSLYMLSLSLYIYMYIVYIHKSRVPLYSILASLWLSLLETYVFPRHFFLHCIAAVRATIL